MSSLRFVGAQELEKSPGSLIQSIKTSGETCYITQDGKAKAVLMDINQYHALMDLVEETESPKTHEVGEETRKHTSVRHIIKKSSTRFIRPRR